jgi:hypothetical protein
VSDDRALHPFQALRIIEELTGASAKEFGIDCVTLNARLGSQRKQLRCGAT